MSVFPPEVRLRSFPLNVLEYCGKAVWHVINQERWNFCLEFHLKRLVCSTGKNSCVLQQKRWIATTDKNRIDVKFLMDMRKSCSCSCDNWRKWRHLWGAFYHLHCLSIFPILFTVHIHWQLHMLGTIRLLPLVGELLKHLHHISKRVVAVGEVVQKD